MQRDVQINKSKSIFHENLQGSNLISKSFKRNLMRVNFHVGGLGPRKQVSPPKRKSDARPKAHRVTYVQYA